MLSEYITSSPASGDQVGDVFENIRDFESRMKERIELNHNFGLSVDTTDPTCDGYHSMLTMPSYEGESSDTGATIYDPEQPDGGAVLYVKTIEESLSQTYAVDTTLNSAVVTGFENTSLLESGMTVSGSGISSDTTILTVDSISQITLSKVATATQADVSLSFSKLKTVPELCVRDNTGKYQVTYNGKLAVGVLTEYTSNLSYVIGVYNFSKWLLKIYGDKLYTSFDGITWTQRVTTPIYISFEAAGEGSIYMAVGTGYTLSWPYGIDKPSFDTTWDVIYTSADGITWTQTLIFNQISNWGTPVYNAPFTCMAYGAGLFVLCQSDGSICTTANGSSVTSRTSGTTSSINYITYGNGVFLALCADGTKLTSSDGITWTATSTTWTYTALRFYNGYFWLCAYKYITGSGYSVRIFRTTDGTTLIPVYAKDGQATLLNMTDIVYNGIYYLCNAHPYLLISYDSAYWHEQYFNYSVYDIHYRNGKLIYFSDSGKLYKSDKYKRIS